MGSMVLCDRCSGWLGTVWAREKASREEAWLGVARDSEESRQLRERERAETENERSEDSGRRTRYFGKWFMEKFSVNRFPYFTYPFSGQKKKISVDFPFYRVPNVQPN